MRQKANNKQRDGIFPDVEVGFLFKTFLKFHKKNGGKKCGKVQLIAIAVPDFGMSGIQKYGIFPTPIYLDIKTSKQRPMFVGKLLAEHIKRNCLWLMKQQSVVIVEKTEKTLFFTHKYLGFPHFYENIRRRNFI
jgi:hypothetical protein